MGRSPFNRAELGRFAEAVAAEFLSSRGGRVVARNVTTRDGELDLIVAWEDEVAAVEVRSATGDHGAERLFTAQKERQVRRVAAGLDPPIFRIDLVTVLVGDSGIKVRWHPRV